VRSFFMFHQHQPSALTARALSPMSRAMNLVSEGSAGGSVLWRIAWRNQLLSEDATKRGYQSGGPELVRARNGRSLPCV
jgi:hypothetical protein